MPLPLNSMALNIIERTTVNNPFGEKH